MARLVRATGKEVARMRKILCFGEALIDFINTKSSPEGPLQIAQFRQFPGGAPANVAVAIAKLGGQAAFAGQVGDDRFGAFLRHSLQTYCVDTSAMLTHPNAHTALAFVFLDADGERSFEFYRQATADLLVTKEQIETTWFDACNIVHICSNTLIDEHILATTLHVLESARSHGCLVSVDVNLRHNLWPHGQCDRDVVRSIVQLADIVKASREEVEFLEPDGVQAFTRFAFESGAKLVVVTDGALPVDVYLPEREFSVTPPAVSAVDTTAAGDGFVGGMLYKLTQNDHAVASIANSDTLMEAIEFAARCGAYTAGHQGVMNALPTLDLLRAASL